MREDIALRADCARCMGLCCVFLAFDRGPQFGFDKEAGEPCRHLDHADRCSIHACLDAEGFSGCARYDCFGAGQAVTAMFAGRSWRDGAETMRVLYDAFVVLREKNKAARLALKSFHHKRRTVVHDGSKAARKCQRSVKWEIPHMPADAAFGQLGQIARTVSDIAAAEHWYGSVLGLTHLYSFGQLAFFDCGGVRLMLSANSEDKAAESILYFRVADIDAAHGALEARGVKFVRAPHMIHRHADGTEEWMAFLEDNEGRPLALMAQTRP